MTRFRRAAFTVHFRQVLQDIDNISDPRERIGMVDDMTREAKSFAFFLKTVKRREIIRLLVVEGEMTVKEAAKAAGVQRAYVEATLLDPDEETRGRYYEVVDVTSIERDLGDL